MKKQVYNILTVSGVKTQTGYIYSYAGYFFGVSGGTGSYAITELTTGALLPLKVKRLADVADNLSSWVDAHADALKAATTPRYARFKPNYTEYEAILTARNRG